MAGPHVAGRPRAALGRAALRGCLAGLALVACLHGGYVLTGPNFHTVLPGAVYRSAQPSGERLAALVVGLADHVPGDELRHTISLARSALPATRKTNPLRAAR